METFTEVFALDIYEIKEHLYIYSHFKFNKLFLHNKCMFSYIYYFG